MNEPKISIIVPTKGRFDYLKALIESARKAIPADKLEFIIVSSDPYECEKMEWMLEQDDMVVICAYNLKSLHSYINIGLNTATGDYFLPLNDDMVIHEDFYAVLCELLHTYYDVLLVKTHIGDSALGLRTAIIGKFTNAKSEEKDFYLMDFIIAKSDVYIDTGYLDENMRFWGGGADLSAKIESAEVYKISYENELAIDHLLADEERTYGNSDPDLNYVRDKWKSKGFVF